MDFQLITSLNAHISSRQTSGHKGEGSSVRSQADSAASNQPSQPGQVNHTAQTNQVSFVSPIVSAANALDTQKVNIDKISAASKLSVVSHDEQRAEEEDAQETARSVFETDASHAANAYQAAGAVFGIGSTDGTSNDTVVFNPGTISPIDIQA